MKRTAVLLGVIALAACMTDRSNDHHLRSVSIANDHATGPGGTMLLATTVSVKLLEHLEVDAMEDVVMIDTAGRSHRPDSVNFEKSSSEGATITARFVVDDGTQVAMLRTSTLDIDVRNSRVTRRAV